jgi:predicted phosphodiesterase
VSKKRIERRSQELNELSHSQSDKAFPRFEDVNAECIALFGGVYSNSWALDAAIADSRLRGAETFFCLGDLGAFGPLPDRVFPLIHEHNIQCLQGNYDDSIGNSLDDCQCGYTDPRDNYFAQVSYDYTLANTNAANQAFLRAIPAQRRLRFCQQTVLLCHGSPRRVNEFLWESTTSDAFLNHLLHEEGVDLIAATHTGIKWKRQTDKGIFVNVGVLGRPENDGSTNVWYTLLRSGRNSIEVEFVKLEYDWQGLAKEMRNQKLPEEFVATIETGWWTTCLEILPSKERRRGKF